MAKKIEGYIDAPAIDPPDTHTKLIASVVAVPFADADPVRHVTLVLHDGPHERAFTESEVRALMDDVIAWVSGYYFEREEFNAIAERHGVSLDPQ